MTNQERAAQRYAADPEKWRAHTRRRYASDPGKQRARVQRYYAQNPSKRADLRDRYRARRLGQLGVVDSDVRGLLMQVQNGRCFHCAVPLGPGAHLDHLRPLALGGLHENENLAMSCPSCNMGRGLVDAGPGPLRYPTAV